MVTLRSLLRYVRQYRLDSILAAVFVSLEVLLEVLIPYTTGFIIDRGINAHSMSNIWKYGGLMVLLALFSLLFGTLSGKFAASASTGFARNLRKAMYENIQTFSFSNIDKFSPAGLITRMTTDVTNVQNAWQIIIRVAVRAPLMMITSLIMCITINRRISLLFLAALAVLAVFLFIVIHFTIPVFKQVFERYDDLNASVQENVGGIRVVKAFVREDYENQKFRTATDNLYRLFVKAETFVAANAPGMMLIIFGMMIAISWFGARFIVAGTMTTGNLTQLFSYVMSVLISMMMLSMIFVMLTMSTASAERMSEVLNEKADIVNPENPVMEVPNGDIDFEGVDFSYPHGAKQRALRHIDLHIPSGETIGIIGPTGCGKTTLVSLISRLYDVTTGSVKVGGYDVREYDLETLRNAVSVVLQKNEIFSGTILENLRWGNPDATLEECREACRLACADEFIEQFPDGYDTRIEQGGTNVSGGQKQRICIARALLKKPKVLVLDDSTSAVDTATDARIRTAFREFIPSTTKIIISQRISSIQDADRILVLESGRVLGFDTHENLLEHSSIYQEIYETQTRGGGDFDQPQ
ncbi:MAG: ABC transporter ATP-binding protein [Clostridia bacterium]|nr:ABC transporter ATP-binding protein [Clostridia bacterium]